MPNSIRNTTFDMLSLHSSIVEPNTKYRLDGQYMVLNPTPEPMLLNNNYHSIIAPFSSMIIVNDEITPTTLALTMQLPRSFLGIDFKEFRDWTPYDGLFANIETLSTNNMEKITFLRSPQDTIGVYTFAPSTLTNDVSPVFHNKQFLIKANLWAAKQYTHCGIHDQHAFVEIHTQVLGFGRMQKFKDHTYSSLCEQIMMAPGYTTSKSFCSFNSNNCQCKYPPHQFYADTDSVWLALEYYPICSEGK